MRRLGIVEFVMSAGGVERVLRGLARAFLEIPEARDWDVTLLLSRYNSAHHRCEWPAELTGPNLHVEWLGEGTAMGRFVDPLAHAQGIGGLRFTRLPAYVAARAGRLLGPGWWRAWVGDPRALIRQASDRFDVLYFTYPFGIDVPEMTAPVVTTPQDFNFKFFLPEGSWVRKLQERRTRRWLDRSDRLLLSSHAVEAELRRFYPQHLAKSEVVHLGIDTEAQVPAPAEVDAFRERQRLPATFALVSGWVAPHKNQVAVVEAMKHLRERGIDLPVVFVGPNTAELAGGPAAGLIAGYPAKVRAALAAGGFVAGKHFHALGYVSDADIRCLQRAATVQVVPSLYEGFGLPGLEAMRAGLPVLLSTIPPFQEQNELLGGVVRLFDPADAVALARELEWVVGHREEAAATARLLQEHVAEAYDWRKTARAYLKAFGEMAARP